MGTGECFPVEAFDELARAEAASFWFRARNRLIVGMLGRHFPDASDFLDVGTGTGYVLAHIHETFPAMRVVGSDMYDEGLSVARRRLSDVDLVRVDARDLPFEEAFDVVGAFDVLEHIDEDQEVIDQVAKALRPRGGIMVLVPQHPWLWSAFDEQAHHVRRYRRADLLNKLRRSGFEIERATSFVSTLLPVMAASRLLRKTPQPEHVAAGRLGRILERALDIERQVIEHGVSLPVGGSLLVVARRA